MCRFVDADRSPPEDHSFSGGGEMAGLVRAHEWASTPLGRIAAWPQSLRTAVELVLASPLAMIVLWGTDLIQIYNDAYARICVDKHPAAVGQPTRECWPEVWQFNAPIYAAVFRGEACSFEAQKLSIMRHGVAEDAFFDLNYSAVRDETGAVAGVLVTVVEVTSRMLVEKAQRAGEERLRGVFENMHEGLAVCEMVYDRIGTASDFRYLEVNAAWERLTGIPPAAVVGHLASKAIPGIEPFWTETFARVVETGKPAHFEYPLAVLGR